MVAVEEAYGALFYLEIFMALLIVTVSYGAVVEMQQHSCMDYCESDVVYSTTCRICR